MNDSIHLSVLSAFENEESASKHKKEFWQKANEQASKETSSQFVVVGRSQMHGVDFMMQYNHSLYQIAKMKLTGEDLRVLLFMQSFLDFNNFIPITQINIAKELDMKQPHVSRSIKKLTDKGLIDKIKKGRNIYYKLSPTVAWKGSGLELQETGLHDKIKQDSDRFEQYKKNMEKI